MTNAIDLYQEFTITTAKYPGAGAAVPEAIIYCGFGLGGECGEIDGKLDAGSPYRFDAIRDELGDDGYYLARLANEVGWKLSELFGTFDDTPAARGAHTTPFRWADVNEVEYVKRSWAYGAAVGRVLERLKKSMRNSAGIPGVKVLAKGAEKGEVFKLDLVTVAHAYRDFAHIIGYSVHEILAANEAKLTDRKKRGVIHGEGDKR